MASTCLSASNGSSCISNRSFICSSASFEYFSQLSRSSLSRLVSPSSPLGEPYISQYPRKKSLPSYWGKVSSYSNSVGGSGSSIGAGGQCSISGQSSSFSVVSRSLSTGWVGATAILDFPDLRVVDGFRPVCRGLTVCAVGAGVWNAFAFAFVVFAPSGARA